MRTFVWSWGPFAILVVGRVWSVDVGRVGIFGVGRMIGFRRVKP